jgi:hypothetical protein
VLSRRDDGQLNARHTPTLSNVSHQSVWYWDGRATTLEGQILGARRVQAGADPAKVAAALNNVPGYRSQWHTPSHFGNSTSFNIGLEHGKSDPNKSLMIQPTGLTEEELDKIVAFLGTLTSIAPWVAPTLPWRADLHPAPLGTQRIRTPAFQGGPLAHGCQINGLIIRCCGVRPAGLSPRW